VFIRHSIISVAALLLYACTPGGAGSTDDSGAGSETGAASGSTDPVTTGSASTGGDPTTSTTGSSGGGSTTAPVTTDTTEATGDATTDASTGGSTTASSTTDVGTTDASSGDASSGGDGLGPAALAAIDALIEAVDGVIWPSESDYGWTVFGLPKAAPVTIGDVKQVVGDLVMVDDVEPPLAEQGVEEERWEQRFDKMTTPQPWWDDYNYMLAEQYEALRTTLKAHLTNIKLFRIGPDNGGTLYGGIDMFVIGETADGDLVGIQTVSVET
jgi:hypothetical protein